MNQTIGFLNHLFLTFLVLVVFAAVGVTLARWLAGRRLSDIELGVAPSLGISVLTIINLLLTSFGLRPSTFRSWLLVTPFLLVAVRQLRNEAKHSQSILASMRSVISMLCRYGLAAIAGIGVYFHFLATESSLGWFTTGVTSGNNDLGSYILQATNILNAGYNNAGLVIDADFGGRAQRDHPAAMMAFAVTSSLLGLSPAQSGIVTMAVFLASLCLASWSLINLLTSATQRFSRSGAIAGAVVVNPLILYMAANFFLAQALVIRLCMAFLCVLLIVFDQSTHFAIALFIPIVGLTAFLASPEVALTVIPALGGLILIQRARQSWPAFVRRVLVSLGSSLILILPLWTLLTGQLEIIRRNARAGAAGWELFIASPSMFLGLSPTTFGVPPDGLKTTVDLGLLGLILIILLFSLMRKLQMGLSFGLLVLGTALAAAVRLWGTDGYQTWKLIITFVPFITVFFVAVTGAIGIREPQARRFLADLSIFVMAGALTWSASTWDNIPQSRYVNQNLIEITSQIREAGLRDVNINVSPYFETMTAAALVGNNARITSPWYFGVGHSFSDGCTLKSDESADESIGDWAELLRVGQYFVLSGRDCKTLR